MRFLLDEDVHPRAAEIARGLGLDAVRVHEIGQLRLSDREQLRLAAVETSLFITRNCNDYLELTRDFFRAGEPHAGVLILSRGLPNDRPEWIAHAMRRWADARSESYGSTGFGAYHLEFLSR